MTLTNCFWQAVDFLIIRIRLIPDKSVGQVWWGRKPLLEESPNHGYHQMDLHEVKWYDGLGHGDLKNWLVPRGSGTQVRKLQIRSWNRGFFMQDLGLKEAQASSWHHGCPNWEDTVNRTQRRIENGTQQCHYPQITSELLSYPIIINSSAASLMFSPKKRLVPSPELITLWIQLLGWQSQATLTHSSSPGTRRSEPTSVQSLAGPLETNPKSMASLAYLGHC